MSTARPPVPRGPCSRCHPGHREAGSAGPRPRVHCSWERWCSGRTQAPGEWSGPRCPLGAPGSYTPVGPHWDLEHKQGGWPAPVLSLRLRAATLPCGGPEDSASVLSSPHSPNLSSSLFSPEGLCPQSPPRPSQALPPSSRAFCGWVAETKQGGFSHSALASPGGWPGTRIQACPPVPTAFGTDKEEP